MKLAVDRSIMSVSITLRPEEGLNASRDLKGFVFSCLRKNELPKRNANFCKQGRNQQGKKSKIERAGREACEYA